MGRPFIELLAMLAFAVIVALAIALAGTAMARSAGETPDEHPDPLIICWRYGDLSGCVREPT